MLGSLPNTPGEVGALDLGVEVGGFAKKLLRGVSQLPPSLFIPGREAPGVCQSEKVE